MNLAKILIYWKTKSSIQRKSYDKSPHEIVLLIIHGKVKRGEIKEKKEHICSMIK